MDDLFKLGEKLIALREEKDAQTAILKEINGEIDGVEYALGNAMAAAECPNFTRGGKQFVLTTATHYSPAANRKDELYQRLKDEGHESLFTVNPKTLESFVRAQRKDYADAHEGEEGYPDWLVGLINAYEKVGITVNNKKS